MCVCVCVDSISSDSLSHFPLVYFTTIFFMFFHFPLNLLRILCCS
uniref:Uncharacterized protein n=1 Tax=Rhizophora mucronata TaxID=61149 RepID=A0A2P2JJB9_RHIMU